MKALTNRNVDEMVNHGINVGYFVNPITGYIHKYIAKTDTREEAIKLYNSNLEGSYLRYKNNCTNKK